jgi:hypothetical protein
MRKFVVMVALLAVVVLGGYLYFFKKGDVTKLVRSGVQQAKGYTPAATPDEAITGFRKAIKGRDYDVAADVYLAGDYAEQMRKGAAAAHDLGGAIDDLLHAMDVKGYDSDKVKVLMKQMEPFPLDIEFANLRRDGDRATAVLVETTTIQLKGDASYYVSSIDASFFRAMAKFPQQTPVELKPEGPSKEKAWRIYLPLTDQTRYSVNRLNERYKTYVKALEKVKYDVQHEPMSKADFEERVRTELDKCAKD